jgi:hypothetical protein
MHVLDTDSMAGMVDNLSFIFLGKTLIEQGLTYTPILL